MAEATPPSSTPNPITESSGSALEAGATSGGSLAFEPDAGAPCRAAPPPTTKNTTIDCPPGIGVPLASTSCTVSVCFPGCNPINVYADSEVSTGLRALELQLKIRRSAVNARVHQLVLHVHIARAQLLVCSRAQDVNQRGLRGDSFPVICAAGFIEENRPSSAANNAPAAIHISRMACHHFIELLPRVNARSSFWQRSSDWWRTAATIGFRCLEFVVERWPVKAALVRASRRPNCNSPYRN